MRPNCVWLTLRRVDSYQSQSLFDKHTVDEVRARERAVCLAELKILRNRLRDCYYSEGVNHLEACKDIAKSYADFINSERFKSADP